MSRESTWLRCIAFEAISTRLKRDYRGYGDTLYMHEAFVRINGKQHYLRWAVGQEEEMLLCISTGL